MNIVGKVIILPEAPPKHTFWDRIKYWSFHSATIVWGYSKIITGILIATAGEAFVNSDIKSAVQEADLPKWIGLSLAVLGIITLVVRMRTVTKYTDETNQILNKNVIVAQVAPNKKEISNGLPSNTTSSGSIRTDDQADH